MYYLRSQLGSESPKALAEDELRRLARLGAIINVDIFRAPFPLDYADASEVPSRPGYRFGGQKLSLCFQVEG